MNKIIKLFILVLIVTTHTAHTGQNTISKLYCSFLGNENVSKKYTEKVQQALKDLDLKNPSNVAIKQMNSVGPIFANIDLISFTAFGIWLNEEYFNKLSEEEQIFHIYHEASHYVQNHHQKLLAYCSGILAITIIGLKQTNNILQSNNPIIKNISVTSLGILALIASYRYLLPCIIKRQEKQADILAAKTLILADKEDVIVAHIKKLNKLKKDENDLWWYSIKEQIKYLKDCLSKQT